jgi:hypothetical protein
VYALGRSTHAGDRDDEEAGLEELMRQEAAYLAALPVDERSFHP